VWFEKDKEKEKELAVEGRGWWNKKGIGFFWLCFLFFYSRYVL